MAKLKITPQFRTRFSEKLMDLGNLAVAALVLGQFVSAQTFSITLLTLGLVLMIFCYIISFVISP